VAYSFPIHTSTNKKRGKREKIYAITEYSSRAMSGGERGKDVATTRTRRRRRRRAKRRESSAQTTSSQTTLR